MKTTILSIAMMLITDAMKIKTAIVAVGHDTKELKATDEAYNSVHPCCLYREDNSDDGVHHKN